MKLTDKKFAPYYLIAAVIILLAMVTVTVITYSVNNAREQETATLPETTTLFMNGEVPYYENLPASSFGKDNFALVDGRIVYTDENISYSTGVDVSSFQGDIDWEKVADDGISFAIIRAGFRGYGTAGSIHEDEKARTNIEGALEAGLDVGVYFYSQAITPEEAKEEAEFVLDIINDYEIALPVVFDWENEPDVGMRTDNLDGRILTDCAITFCEAIKVAGYTPSVYFNLTDAYVRYNLDAIKDYTFWYAQHEGTFPKFYYEYSIWQYSDSGNVDGIDGNVDLNICFNKG